MGKGMSSFDAHKDTVCATLASQSGVLAASASVRFAKTCKTCCSCPSVSVRPWRCRRCIKRVSVSEIVYLDTVAVAANFLL